METLYSVMDFLLPYEWAQMTFMKHAFLGILLAAPLLGLLSTMVVNQKMAFFSDAIGHSALTGIGIGVVLGMTNPTLTMMVFAIGLGVVISYFSYKHPTTTDTVIGVFSALAVALGTMLLSKGGNFNQYTSYLIGDLLSISVKDLQSLGIVAIFLAVMWYLLFNQLVLTSLNTSLARSRHIHTFIIQLMFTVLVAIVVVLCIPWIGVLLINAFLILPAATSRNVAKTIRGYQLGAISIALVAGIIGLIGAYFLGTSAGATIVVVMGSFYVVSYLYMYFLKR